MRRDVPRLLQHGITALALKTEPGAAGALVALAERIELWPIEKLRPYERNPRTHSEGQVDQIAASMVEFGWTNPILVDENAGILAGHGRLLAARKLGLTEVPVIRFEHLSEAQKRAYLIADNQLALSEMATKMDATLEHLRIGAIKGQILDADGSAVIYDLFTEFGISQHTEIDFDLDNASPAPGVIKKKCHDIAQDRGRARCAAVRARHAICGADFFDDLITHFEVAKAYDRYLDGAFLRQGQARGSFEYSGIVFEEYRGRVGTVEFTDASKAYFFPVGMPGLFRQYNAPADFVETANTIGLPRYAKQAVDQQFARWVMLHVQSNLLPICTRPRVLIKGKRT